MLSGIFFFFFTLKYYCGKVIITLLLDAFLFLAEKKEILNPKSAVRGITKEKEEMRKAKTTKVKIKFIFMGDKTINPTFLRHAR